MKPVKITSNKTKESTFPFQEGTFVARQQQQQQQPRQQKNKIGT